LLDDVCKGEVHTLVAYFVWLWWLFVVYFKPEL